MQGTCNGVSATGTATIVVLPVRRFITLTAAGNWVEVKGATAQLMVDQFLDQFRNPLAAQPTLTWSVATVPSGAHSRPSASAARP